MNTRKNCRLKKQLGMNRTSIAAARKSGKCAKFTAKDFLKF